MKFFHVDRAFTIESNFQEQYPMPNVFSSVKFPLSRHGFSYLSAPYGFEPKDFDYSFAYETAFEYIRALKYPHLPSRFSAIFASATEEDALRWAILWGIATFKIVPIECEIYHCFDSNWLGKASVSVPLGYNGYSYGTFCELADHYWNKELTENPLLEYLLFPPSKSK